MEDPQIGPSAGPTDFMIDSPQKICVAFRIKNNHRISTQNILADQKFRKPCFADLCGAEHEHVSGPVSKRGIHIDFALVHADTVQYGIAATACDAAQKFPSGRRPGFLESLYVRLLPSEPFAEKQFRIRRDHPLYEVGSTTTEQTAVSYETHSLAESKRRDQSEYPAHYKSEPRRNIQRGRSDDEQYCHGSKCEKGGKLDR